MHLRNRKAVTVYSSHTERQSDTMTCPSDGRPPFDPSMASPPPLPALSSSSEKASRETAI